MPRCRLFAIDLDGTRVRDDHEIDPRDKAAVRAARAAGVEIVIATGRLPHQALPCARELELTSPLICADGGVVIGAKAGTIRDVRALPLRRLRRSLGVARATGLPLLFLAVSSVYGLEEHRVVSRFLGGWSDRFTPLATLDDITAAPEPILAAFLLGTEAEARKAAHLLGPSNIGQEIAVFRLAPSEWWTAQLRPARVDKGLALKRLAQRRGIPRVAVGAIGDWYNDLGMLKWAPLSFAMGHAPTDVAQAARHRLVATAAVGGGIAEAIAAILGTAASA
jgi:Cof subfamily protein (haloacid dehalogenase superfamily)